jgi:hypothetical protein
MALRVSDRTLDNFPQRTATQETPTRAATDFVSSGVLETGGGRHSTPSWPDVDGWKGPRDAGAAP